MASSVEDQLNLDALHEMKKKFDAADEDGNDGIELDEFIQHFADVLGGGSLTETQLRQLFMKIDADGNGSVDWDEFTNFMFLMRAPAPSDDDDRAITSAYADSPTHLDLDEDDLASRGGSSAASHADVITCVEFVPSLDKVATGSRDGTWMLWHAEDFSHAATVRNRDAETAGKTPPWITAIKDLTDWPGRNKRVAVAAMDRTVSVFTFRAGGKIELTGKFRAVGNMGAPARFTTAPIAGEPRLVFGGSDGAVRALVCDLDAPAEAMELGGATTRAIRAEDVALVHDRHSDWVTHVAHVEQLNAIVSASMDGRAVVVDAHPTRRDGGAGDAGPGAGAGAGAAESSSPSRPASKSSPSRGSPAASSSSLHRLRFDLKLFPNGVRDMAWCPRQSLFAACGVSRDVVLWNASTGRVVSSLAGHKASVAFVAVDETTDRVVSAGTDKVIKVWDLRANACAQTLVDDVEYKVGTRVVESHAAMAHDAARRRLVTGVTRLGFWRQRLKTKENEGHDRPVVACAYNHGFDVAVSADEGGNVHLWDLDGGAREGRFVAASRGSPGARVTAMAFDRGERRLLTGSDDGSVKCWNHNNGQLLKEMVHRQPKGAVTQVLHVQDEEKDARLIVAAGWNRKVIVWPESDASTLDDYRVLSGHEEDILCAAHCRGTDSLATGDYGGMIILWNVYSFHKKATLRIESSNAYNRACERLCFLSARDDVEGGPVLLSGGADGFVRAWLTHPEGGGAVAGEDDPARAPAGTGAVAPFASFRAAAESEDVTALATDPENALVFVGDSAGHVRVFDVVEARAANAAAATEPEAAEEPTEEEPVTPPSNDPERGVARAGGEGESSSPARTSPLAFEEKAAWRPHARAIASVDYLPSRRYALIASVDARIALWTLEGARVGVFGEPATWGDGPGPPQASPGGGDTPAAARPWRIDAMPEIGPDAAASAGDAEANVRAEYVKRILRERLEATLLGRARGSSDEDAGGGGDRSGGSPSAEAARFVRDKRAAADDVGWSDYQNNLTHSSLLMHELGATPASPKEALYGEDGRPKAHEASPPPAKERLRGTGRALRKFSEARAG